MAFIPAGRLDPQSAAERAVSVIGFGYDLTNDIRLSACKPCPSGSDLIDLQRTHTKDLRIPGGVIVSGVSEAIKCDKGERTRFHSDVLSFNQMSEQFNQEIGLSGKVPSGLFNSMFSFKGCWQKDAASTKCLAFDGWKIALYTIELAKSQIALSKHVKQEVPSSWDPAKLAEFIEKYGTHIVVGVKMGGKDTVHIKQLQQSTLEPAELQKLLKQIADQRFSEAMETDTGFSKKNKNQQQSVAWDLNTPFMSSIVPSVSSHSKNDDILSISIRRGGYDEGQSHDNWLSTVAQFPNAVSMSFVPIVSLLNGVRGSGFLSHAINLYLRYKPQIEELRQFLEFQLPRQWAPAFSDLPLAPRNRKQVSPSLQFRFMGSKLFINTVKVDSGNRPVTGIRLYLEGKRSDHLAIHLQHLSNSPESLHLSDDQTFKPTNEQIDKGYFEPIKSSLFSHICTAPVEHTGSHFDDPGSIVTKAWFEVKGMGIKKTLFLRLGFSTVASARIRRSEWHGSSASSRKSGFMSTLISTTFSMGLVPPENPKPEKVDLNSAIYPGGPPVPNRVPKLTNVVDTKEMVRGPEEPPGYWVVSGAKLCVVNGKISIMAKFSLLTIMLEDSMM
ncbi:MACPF domain-containing protein NSL1 [Impatiens glandulifera]|uniref:MACPF domain-containing protein NSL1 n=1 Tax=Impatiens glandulifera TaxID=253017 RepID=UPI001FB06F9D|nr:MACPF domain-containing protein NSL1 [Impatiens glandulifera]